MIREELSGKIKVLVDHLRLDKKRNFSLTDIASVTEILINTMEAYFHSIDVTIYREFRDLSDYLANARVEITKLTPGDLEKVRIPRAGQELDAIVEATEAATNTIMEAAEEIMADNGDKEAIEAACTRIFEACSFQDITGQRISKVVATLEHIEHRIVELKDVFEVEDDDEFASVEKKTDGEVVLEGPALAGEGMEQSEIDVLLAAHDKEARAGADAKPDAEESEPADAKPAAKESEPAAAKPAAKKSKPAAAKPEAKESEPAAAKPAAKKSKPAAAKPEAKESEPAADEDEPKSDEVVSQDDIDAMFG